MWASALAGYVLPAAGPGETCRQHPGSGMSTLVPGTTASPDFPPQPGRGVPLGWGMLQALQLTSPTHTDTLSSVCFLDTPL